MPTTAWNDQKLAAAHLLACVEDLKALGCYALEYPKANPAYHIAGSRHAAKSPFGVACAADINRDKAGDEDERQWFKRVGQKIAFGHGLSVTCGIYGYVPNHSGGNMHLHIDDAAWSNVGDKRGVFRTPNAARPSLPAWPVRAFQKQHGLVVDGVPGKLTTAALQRAVGATPDSSWGKATTAAIQKKVGAGVDSILGGETYYKLGLWIAGGCK